MTSFDSEGKDEQPGPGPELPPTHQYYGQAQPPPLPYQQPYQQPLPGQPYPPQPYYPAYAPTPPTDGLAIGALVVGVGAMVLMCAYGLGLLAAPVALVLGRVSMKRIDRSGGQLGGRGLAQAGFILGIVGTVLLVLLIALIVVLVAVGMNGGFDSEPTYNSLGLR